MKLFSKLTGIAAVAAALIFCLTMCATYVPVNSVRPPTIDTSGIQRLAIKPFVNKSGGAGAVGGPVGAQLARYMTETTERLIKSTGKFTIVAPTDPNADGVFTGEIRSFESKETRERIEKKDKNGEPYFDVLYTREVYLEFAYSVIHSRTDMPVGTVIREGTTAGSGLASNVADTLTLAKSIFDSQMSGLKRDLVPVIVSANRQLMNETSKDKEVKQKMNAALALVKNGNYEEAIRQYDAISGEYNSAAAGTNAEILRESIASSGAALSELNRLFSDADGLADKAVKNAVGAIHSKLPNGANIMIMKAYSRERDMLDYVVNQMTKNIIQAGKLKVVDRSNQAFIIAEQQYQLSADVDDNSAVSIGRQLGVHYIVICWISGEKSLRRFNQKVLSVETTQITDLSDFEI